jgi:acyl-CoA reductase-like NAD-dependent aldehyde dehydrogenase
MAAEAQYTVPLLINGEERTTTTTFSVVSPASHKAIWTSSSASLSDATDAVAAAQSAFPSWSKTKPAYRRTILLKAADIMQERAQECRDYIMQETGAGALFVKEVDIPGAVEMLRDVAGRISGVCGAVPVCAAEGTSALVFKEPYGVVLGIAPW